MIACIDALDIVALYHALSRGRSSSLHRLLFLSLQQSCAILPSPFSFFSPRWWLTALDSLSTLNSQNSQNSQNTLNRQPPSLQHLLLLLCSFPLHFPLLLPFLHGATQSVEAVIGDCRYFVKAEGESGLVAMAQTDKTLTALVLLLVASDS